MIYKKIHTPTDKWRFLSRYLKENGAFSPFVKDRSRYRALYHNTPFFPKKNVLIDELIISVDSSFCWTETPEGSNFWATLDTRYREFLARIVKEKELNSMFFIKNK